MLIGQRVRLAGFVREMIAMASVHENDEGFERRLRAWKATAALDLAVVLACSMLFIMGLVGLAIHWRNGPTDTSTLQAAVLVIGAAGILSIGYKLFWLVLLAAAQAWRLVQRIRMLLNQRPPHAEVEVLSPSISDMRR
jgi:hypothetical protein